MHIHVHTNTQTEYFDTNRWPPISCVDTGAAVTSCHHVMRSFFVVGNVSRQYSDRRVWPNLMKAGMQLTMFGLGLTNPQLGG